MHFSSPFVVSGFHDSLHSFSSRLRFLPLEHALQVTSQEVVRSVRSGDLAGHAFQQRAIYPAIQIMMVKVFSDLAADKQRN